METEPTNVLIIDDSADDVQRIRVALAAISSTPFLVEDFPTLEAGLARAEKAGFDLVLLDLNLPDSQGLATLQSALERCADTPLLVLTDAAQEALAIQAVQQGAQDYVVKDDLDPPQDTKTLGALLERNRLRNQLRALSINDELTGLRNRRGFLTLAEQQIRLAERNRNGFLFLLVDINKLKHINEIAGYAGGDKAIQAAAQVLQQTFRRSDLIGRIGGDEFAVLAIKSQQEDSHIMLDRLYRNLSRFNRTEDRPFQLAFSVGLSQWTPQAPKALETLMREADRDLSLHQDEDSRDIHAPPPERVAASLDWAVSAQGESPDSVIPPKAPESILLVEDNPGDTYLLQEYLKEIAGSYTLTQVPQLSSALWQLGEQTYDLILLDLTLPDSHGLDTIRTMAAAAADTPIVVLTGTDDILLASQALQLGAQDYLSKGSFDAALLNRTFRYAIERNKMRLQNTAYARQLQISESRFRRIIEQNADGILILNQVGQVLYANPAAEAFFSRRAEELESQLLDLPVGVEQAVEIELPQDDGRLVYLEMRQVEIPWQASTAFLAALRDVTQRVQAKKALRESQERLNSIFQNAVIGIYQTSPQGEILFANPAMIEMLGFDSLESLASRNLEETGFARLEERQHFKTLIEAKGQVVGLESAWVKADGSLLTVRESAKIVYDAQGQVRFYEGTVEDISQQVATEKQIQLQSAALDVAANAIFITDQHGDIIYANAAFSDLTGYELEEVLGQNPRFLNSGFHDQEFYQQFWGTISNGLIWQGEIVNRHKNGSQYTDLMTVSPLRDAHGEIAHYIAIKQDISARKHTERILLRRVDELMVLNAVATAVVEETDEDSLIARFTDIVGQMVSPDHFGVLLLDGDGRALRMHPSYQGVPENIKPDSIGIEQGVVGPVAASGISRLIPDVRQEPAFIYTTPGIRSCLSVPMLVGESVIGVLNAESTAIGAFSREEESLFVTLAGQLATAIAQLRNRASERAQRLRAEALSDSALALNSSLAIDQVLDQILENIARVVPYETASLMMNDGEYTQIIRYRAPGRQVYFQAVETMKLRIDEIYTFRHMQETGESILIADVRLDPNWTSLKGDDWIHAYLGVPIRKEATVLGYLNLNHREPGFFNQMQAKALEALAHQLAVAIENARLYSESQQRAEELARLYKATGALLVSGRPDLESLGRVIVQNVIQEFGQSNCSLFLVEAGNEALKRVAVAGAYISELAHAGDLLVNGSGLVPAAIRQKEIINEPEVLERTDYTPNWPAAHSEIAIPLMVGSSVVGVLDIQSADPAAFDRDDERVLSVFAGRAALAIENARLYIRQQNQLLFLESLREIDLAITGSLDLQVILDVIMKQVVSQLKVDAVNILLMDSFLFNLKPSADTGFASKEIRNHEVRIGEGLAGVVAHTGRVLYEPDLLQTAHTCNRQSLFRLEGFTSYYGVPLKAKGQVKGVMELYRRGLLEVSVEWEEYVSAVSTQTAIALDNSMLFERLQRSFTEIALAYDTTLEGWAKALELRDQETEGHAWRVVDLTLRIARAMGIAGEELLHIRRGALLHDIGKMGVPDAILQKPGPLTEEEWQVMRQHPLYSHQLLSGISYLHPALSIPQYHHEKWDGSGYPYGLDGEKIPLPARIFAVVDVWDALTSDRPYRQAWSRERALAYIQESSGRHFDPQVVEKFLQLVEMV